MIKVSGVRALDARPPREAWEEKGYPSPDGRWRLRLYDPWEWHMGAYGWKVALEQDGKDVTADHGALMAGVSGRGCRMPSDLQPWSSGSRHLALCTWEDEPVLIYDVARNTQTTVDVRSWSSCLMWSPRSPILAAVALDKLSLRGLAGQELASAALMPFREFPPRAFWIAGSDMICVSTYSPVPSPGVSLLRCFDGTRGALEMEVDISPGRYLPYDEARYREVRRDRFSLVLDPSNRAVGSLLDRWLDVVYDSRRSTLALAVYRPVGAPFEEERELRCTVEEKWLELELSR